MIEQPLPSFRRWLKHFLYIPVTKRYFSGQDLDAITQAVQQAEQGHIGEIQVVIEGHLPGMQAYYQTPKMRARQLFAELGVWDTEFNSGILLYLNLCEQAVEIVVDRGIFQVTQQKPWDEICQGMITQLKQKNFRQAVIQGIEKTAIVLHQYYAQQVTDRGNELDNRPVMLD